MEDQSGALLLSIKWDYASLIFSGEKTVELRRTRPRVVMGDQVLVYAPSPHKALVGGFTVSGVISGSPTSLWRRIGLSSGITRTLFMQYYEGAQAGFAIKIVDAWELDEPVPLGVLRKRLPDFHPPQVFRYLDEIEHGQLVA